MLASTMGSTLRTEALAGGFEGQAPLGRHHRHFELRPRGSDLARCVVALSENVPDYAPVERAEPPASHQSQATNAQSLRSSDARPTSPPDRLNTPPPFRVSGFVFGSMHVRRLSVQYEERSKYGRQCLRLRFQLLIPFLRCDRATRRVRDAATRRRERGVRIKRRGAKQVDSARVSTIALPASRRRDRLNQREIPKSAEFRSALNPEER